MGLRIKQIGNNDWKKALLGAFAVVVLVFGWGCTAAEADNPEMKQDTMQIHGKISVKGSEPHTYLCLSTDSGTDYRLEGALRDQIWGRYQQERIRLEGIITKKAIGPGFPAVFTVHEIVSTGP